MTEETLFREALSRPPEERATFLEKACAGRPELRAAVEQLLIAHEKPENILDRPPADLDPTVDSAPNEAAHQATGAYASKTVDPLAAAGDHVASGVVIAGRYTLVEKIGEGGMGDVWVASQTDPVKRRVALKLIKAGMDTRAVLQRFEQERQALAVMEHPNIARVIDGGMTAERRPYFVMELVNGLPLTRFCDEARLGIRERLELFASICQAVQHAHQKGIIHRDLKPSNILVTVIDGRPVPKVIDFGVAKATSGRLTDGSLSTQFGAVVGTLEYMSPEQAGFGGDDIDTRADIYSLGVILYELLTGLRPIDANRLRKAAFTEMIRIIKEEDPSKPSTRLSSDASAPSAAALRHTEPRRLAALLRGELDWVVMKCLDKQRARRYETANGLARDIQRYLANEVVEARPPSARYLLRKFVSRHRGRVLASGLLLLVLLAGIAGTTWGLFREAKANAELTQTNAELTRTNADLARSRAAVQQRYDLAVEAIKTLHTGVSEDFLLQQDQFKGLRDRLLTSASGFYEKLGALLKGNTDLPSRRALLEANQAVAGLSYTVSGPEVALALLQRVLAGREALATASGGDPELTTDVAESLLFVGAALQNLGRGKEALAAYERTRSMLASANGGPPDGTAARSTFAEAEARIGTLLAETGRAPEGLRAVIRARDLQKALAEQNPGDLARQEALAITHIKIGYLQERMRQTDEALASYRASRAIMQKLVEADPTTPVFRSRLASSLARIGGVLVDTGNSPDGLASLKAARAIQLKLVATYPGIARFKFELADTHDAIGNVLSVADRTADALTAIEASRAIRQQQAEANPTNIAFQDALAKSHMRLGNLLNRMGKPAEAQASLEAAIAIMQRLTEANPAVTYFRTTLAGCYKDTGRLLRDHGRPAAALPYYRRAVALQQAEVDADPSQARRRDFLAWFLTDYAMISREAEQHGEAFRAARRALAIWVGRLAEQPGSLSYNGDNLAWTLSEGDHAARQTSGESEWLVALEPLARAFEKAVASHPNVAEYQSNLAGTLTRMADVQRAVGSLADARGTYDRAMAIRERLVSEHPASPMYRSQLAYSLRRRGLARHDPAGAADTRRALEIYDGLTSRSADEWYETACCHAAMGGPGEPPGSGRAENDRAMDGLRKAVGLGFVNLYALRTEAALDLLRGRDDFQLLMLDLAFPSEPFAR